MGKMSNKYSDRDLARAFILLATAVQEARVCAVVRKQIPRVRADMLRLAKESSGAISAMDDAFSAVYDLINDQMEPPAEKGGADEA